METLPSCLCARCTVLTLSVYPLGVHGMVDFVPVCMHLYKQ